MLRVVVAVCLLLIAGNFYGQKLPDFYISNQGKDYYSGTSPALAKKTIASTVPFLLATAATNGNVTIALNSGSTFNENLITSYPVNIKTYSNAFDRPGFAIMNGSMEFNNGWIVDSGKTYTYKQAIPYKGFEGYGINGIGSYSYMYIFEIDKDMEKTAPFTARKLLQFVTSKAAVESTPGSFYSPINTTENPKQMYMHTSDGKSPDNNLKYRYEVTVRDWAINSTYQNGNSFENLWVRGFGAGNGMLPSGDHSYYNKIIFGPGAGIHHVVVRGGIINHSLFLPGAKNTNDFAIVFYDVEGLSRHCKVSNSIFLDVRAPLYAHTSQGTNYGAIEMDSIVGFANSSERDAFMFTSNTDSVFLNNIYADGYSTGYNYGSAKFASITNSYFKNVTYGIAYSSKNAVTATIKNVYIKTSRAFANGTGIIMQTNTSLRLSNSILHIASSGSGAFISGSGNAGSFINANGNIFVCDIDSSATLNAARTNTTNGIATTNDRWDYNIYVLLKGKKIQWNVSNGSTNNGKAIVDNFAGWQQQSGQDTHSLFFDLRNDARGLKAIFTDADNGNYDLANTPEGRQIAALHAGMTEPITCFLTKPSYEQAADMIKNDEAFSVHVCRNPCEQNTIRVNNTLMVSATNANQVRVQWSIGEQNNIDHYELQRSKQNLLYERIAVLPVSADSDYVFNDNVIAGITYQYRLLIIAKAGNVCYSNPKKISMPVNEKFTLYPNPAKDKLYISMNGFLGKVSLSILTANGVVILQKEIFNLSAVQSVNLINEPKGIYFLKMETSEGVITQKFVLK